MPKAIKKPNVKAKAPSVKPPKNKVNKLLKRLNRKAVGAPGQLGTLASNPTLSPKQEAKLMARVEKKEANKRVRAAKKKVRKKKRQVRLDKAANFKPSFI